MSNEVRWGMIWMEHGFCKVLLDWKMLLNVLNEN